MDVVLINVFSNVTGLRVTAGQFVVKMFCE
jgi:hypothetical protein